MAAKAEFRLTNSTYHGEKNNCNFECYVTVLKEQHQILYNYQEDLTSKLENQEGKIR